MTQTIQPDTTNNPYPTIQDKINLLKVHGIDAETDDAGTAVILRNYGSKTMERAVNIFTEHGIRVYFVHLTVLLNEFNKHYDGFFQVVTDPGQTTAS